MCFNLYFSIFFYSLHITLRFQWWSNFNASSDEAQHEPPSTANASAYASKAWHDDDETWPECSTRSAYQCFFRLCKQQICSWLLETAFLKENRKKIKVKKRFPQFFLGMYVLCVCVCLSVGTLQTSSFNIGDWNFNLNTYLWISQNGIFYFFQFFIFHFSPFSLFQGCE